MQQNLPFHIMITILEWFCKHQYLAGACQIRGEPDTHPELTYTLPGLQHVSVFTLKLTRAWNFIHSNKFHKYP